MNSGATHMIAVGMIALASFLASNPRLVAEVANYHPIVSVLVTAFIGVAALYRNPKDKQP